MSSGEQSRPTMSFYTMADPPTTSPPGRAPAHPQPQFTLSYAPSALPPVQPLPPGAIGTLSYTAAGNLLVSNTPTASFERPPSTILAVAFYTPQGIFLPPLQPLTIFPTTTLKNLILGLQSTLSSNVGMMSTPTRLLVSCIQVRIYNGVGSGVFGVGGKNLPKIEGVLQGRRREAMGNGCVFVAWNEVDTGGVNKGHKMEQFWMATLRWLLVDAISTTNSSSISLQGESDMVFGAAERKKPMLKVTTVIKVHDPNERDDTMAGGHLFAPFSVRYPVSVPRSLEETRLTSRAGIHNHGGHLASGSGSRSALKQEPNLAQRNFASDFATSSTSFSQPHTRPQSLAQSQQQENQRSNNNAKPTAMPDETGDAKMAAANELLEKMGLAQEAKKLRKKLMSEVEKNDPNAAKSDTHYKDVVDNKIPPNQGSVWKQSGGYDKSRPFDPKRNWGIYQRKGESKDDEGYENRQKVHDLLDLSHVPFDGPPVEPWGKFKEAKVGVLKEGHEKREHAKIGMEMLPFANINAEELEEALQAERENKPLPNHIKKFWAEQERIKGFKKIDDIKFFPDGVKEGDDPTSNRVDAAKEFKHHEPSKMEIRNLLYGSAERHNCHQGSAYAESLVDGGCADGYSGMSSGLGVMSTGGMTLNSERAVADNAFKPALTSFIELASMEVKSKTPGPGFYDLMHEIKGHKVLKGFGSLFEPNQADQPGQAGATSGNMQFADSSFNNFNSLPGMNNQNHSTYEGFNAQASGHNGTGYIEMGGGFNEMGNAMGGGNYQGPTSFGAFNAMSPAGTTGYGGSMMSSSYNQSTGFNQFGYGSQQQQWTSLGGGGNHQGPTYNSFGAQSTQHGNLANTNNSMSRDMGRYPSFVPTPTPNRGRQSRYFAAVPGTQQGHQGNGYNTMAGTPTNTGYTTPGAYMNTGSNSGSLHPPAGSFAHPRVSGTGPAPRRGGFGGTNPPTTQRVRRPVPIIAPPGTDTSSTSSAFKHPSPTRSAVDQGFSSAASGAGSATGMGTSNDGGNGSAANFNMPAWNPQKHFQQYGQSPRATSSSSPQKKPAFGTSFDNALKSAFNGPKNPFADM